MPARTAASMLPADGVGVLPEAGVLQQVPEHEEEHDDARRKLSGYTRTSSLTWFAAMPAGREKKLHAPLAGWK